jgi:hypothetical protein
MAAPLDELLPELQAWNEGKAVGPLDYVYGVTTPEMLLACCALFWPEFVEFGGYILRRGFSIENLRAWERSPAATKRQTEAAVNYLGIGDLFPSEEQESDLTRARLEYLGGVLCDAYSAKLERDFPERTFKVEMIENEDEYALTFFQA